MPRITLGNRLYLYQLLRNTLGVGKQTMLQRVEEVLLADDIFPSDLECVDVRELLEQLDDFVRLTVFKKGRVYATVLSQPEWDKLLEQADEPTDKKPAEKASRRSWKRKRTAKQARPAKPRPKGRGTTTAQPAETKEAGRDDAPAEDEIETETEVAAPATVDTKPSPFDETPAEEAPHTKPADLAPSIPEDTPAGEDSANDTPAEPASAPITFTITYDPGEPKAKSPLQPSPKEAQLPKEQAVKRTEESPQESTSPSDDAPCAMPKPTAKALDAVVQTHAPAPQLPQNLADELYCPDRHLADLYQILPFDTDPLSLLSEDWRVALSTQTYALSNGVVTFPLRFLHQAGGEPVRVSMRRGAPNTSGKRWSITGMSFGPKDEPPVVGFEGLPQEDLGAWSHLGNTGISQPYAPVDPLRELAHFAVLGSWDSLLATLASLAEAEDWMDGNALLREYLSVTFLRVRREGKLATSTDERLCAFDTGLFTPHAKRIFMCFEAISRADLPWRLAGFCAEDNPSLTSRLPRLPEPAAYVHRLEDVTLASPYEVSFSDVMAKTYGKALAQPAHDALRRAQRSYRLATPAYDPQADELRLLLPLQAADDNHVTRALVLAPHETGHYVATAALSLERARMCARVVTADLPSWLL